VLSERIKRDQALRVVDECTAVVSVSGSRVAMTASKGQSAGRVSAIPAFDTIMNRKRSRGRSDDLLRLIAKVLRSAVLGVEIRKHSEYG
jgi:hypothetical protein